MKRISITEIETMSINEVKQMKGEFTLSSYVPMAMFIKKLKIAKVSFVANYKDNKVNI